MLRAGKLRLPVDVEELFAILFDELHSELGGKPIVVPQDALRLSNVRGGGRYLVENSIASTLRNMRATGLAFAVHIEDCRRTITERFQDFPEKRAEVLARFNAMLASAAAAAGNNPNNTTKNQLTPEKEIAIDALEQIVFPGIEVIKRSFRRARIALEQWRFGHGDSTNIRHRLILVSLEVLSANVAGHGGADFQKTKKDLAILFLRNKGLAEPVAKKLEADPVLAQAVHENVVAKQTVKRTDDIIKVHGSIPADFNKISNDDRPTHLAFGLLATNTA